MTTLPESICNLTSLQDLYLEGNQLTTLPESLGNLTSLQNLWLHRNQLTTLPESICNLQSLQNLNLNFNQFITFPYSITQLTSIKFLSLSRNQLRNLPESIGNLTSLEVLWLETNQLSDLPNSISNLKSLLVLNLTNNKFSIFPESLCNLQSLQRLNLNVNQLTTLPESICNLNSLQVLMLNYNQLTTLPESLGQLKWLQELYLSDNKWVGEWAEVNKNDIPTMRKLCRKLHGIVVFISHAWDDQKQYRIVDLKKYLENDVVVQEQDILLNVVHNVFVCEEDLVEDIQKFMTENVPKSQLLVFAATKNSLKSQACRYELYLASRFNVKIVPIKGFDVQWADLKCIDTSEFDQREADLSNPEERFEFNDGCKNFSEICEKLGNYVKTHESELKKSKKEAEEMEKTKEILTDVIDSKKFRAIIQKNVDIFNTLFHEVNSNQIPLLEYLLKLGKTLKERST